MRANREGDNMLNTSKKFYDILLNLNKVCYLDGVYQYIKGSTVRAFIEAALSLFVLESLMIYTNVFRVNTAKITANEMYTLILAPILITITSCIAYSFLVSKKFINELKLCSELLPKPNDDTNNIFIEKEYAKVDHYFKNIFRKTHLWGVAFYFATACVIDMLCIFHYNITKLPITIIVGTISGALWNYQDFCVDQSLKWHKLFRVLSEGKITESKAIRKEKISYHILYNIFHIVILILIVAVFVFILLNPHPSLIVELNFGDLDVLTMSFLIIASFTLTSFYIRNVLKLHYSKDGANKIYFTFHDIIDKNSLYDNSTEKQHG